MSITGTCGGCGLPGHRYGTTDPHHDYSATACINSLRSEVERLQGLVGREHVRVGECPDCLHRWKYHSPAGCLVPSCRCSEPDALDAVMGANR